MNIKPLWIAVIITVFKITIAHTQNMNASENTMGYVITAFDSINGQISINFDRNMVLVKTESSYLTLRADQLKRVTIYQGAQTGFTTYYSRYFADNPKKFLFKAVIEGPNPLLYREGLRFDQYSTIEYLPYFTLINDNVISLEGKEAIKILAERDNELTSYMKAHKIKGKNIDEILNLFEFINRGFELDDSYYAEDGG